MATERRKRTQRGSEIIEFGLTAILYVPMLIGAFVVGMNLIRSNSCNQVCRDLTDMYIHGADFSTYGMQAIGQKLAGGLGLNIGSSYAGNSNSNTSNAGNGLVTVTQVMWVGSTASGNCVSVLPATCTNHDSFVYTQRIQFGNGTLSNANTDTLGTAAGATINNQGIVQNPVTDGNAKLSSTAQSTMQALWQTTSNGQTPLNDGQVVYVVETYFQSPDLSVGSFAGNGVYARYFF